MSDNSVDKTLYREQTGADGREMPGGGPHGADAHEPRSRDRVVTSSGTAPTGGTPVGGASDRVIPSKAVRDAATNDNVGVGALGRPDPGHSEEHGRHPDHGGDPGPLDR